VTIALPAVETLLAAIAVLFLGMAVNRAVPLLSNYNIPDPITGGILFAVFATILYLSSRIKLSLDLTVKPTLLLLFFASVGLTADLRLLAKGGAKLAIFLALVCLPFVIAQNLLGVATALGLDLHPILGLVAGTITLVGGHGTGAAYAERFAEVNNIQAVMELTMTSATLGLILGGVIGGPVAQALIRRYGLTSHAADDADSREEKADEKGVTSQTVLMSLAALLVAVVAGKWLADLVGEGVVTLPSFVWCLFVGVILRNGGPLIGLRLNDQASSIIGSISLSLFLAMTMMAIKLTDVVNVAGPLLAILVLQTLMVALWAWFIAYRLMGRDYESAVMAAGFCGFMMGSTATAIANMQALVRRYGAAPQAMLVIPLAGAFFIDLMNALILSGFLSLSLLGG
jgi:glutamate:Na+ symporter, ESS family